MRTRAPIQGRRRAVVSVRTAIALSSIALVLTVNAPTIVASIRARSEAVVRVSAGGERIALIRAARGVTTMLSMPAEAKEAVCGDLFDAQTGNGCFVIQRSGRDLFLKPLKASGATNLFVKTESATYAFDLVVVPSDRAMRIVFVDTAAPDRALALAREHLERDRAALVVDRERLAADRATSTAELDRLREKIDEESRARARVVARDWLIEGAARAVPIARRKARGRSGIEIMLGEAALRLGTETWLRCTIRNTGPKPLVVASSEQSGGTRNVEPVNRVAPAGGEVSIVLRFVGGSAPADVLRMLDPEGVELVAIKPFR